jgi:hypothetical protein
MTTIDTRIRGIRLTLVGGIDGSGLKTAIA